MGRNTIIISGLLLAIFGMVAFVLMMTTGFITGIISGSFAVGMITTVIVGVCILGSIPGLKFFRSRIFIGMIIVSGLVGLYQRLPEIVASLQKEEGRYADSQTPETLKKKEEEMLAFVKKGTSLYKRTGKRVKFEKKMENDLFCRITEKFLSTDKIRYIELVFPVLNDKEDDKKDDKDKKKYMEGTFDKESLHWSILASDYEKSLADIKAEKARAEADKQNKEAADAAAKAKDLEKSRLDAERQEAEKKRKEEEERKRRLVMGTEVVLEPVEDNGRYRQYRLPVDTQLGDSFVLKEAIASRGFLNVFVGNTKKGEYPKKVIPAKTIVKIDEYCNRSSDGSFYLSLNSDYDILTSSNIVVYHKKGGA